MKIFLVIVALLILHVVLNASRLVSTLFYYQKFKYKNPNMSEYVPAVDRLFDKAGTNQVFVRTRFEGKSITYCLGMNNYRTELDDLFRKTIGVYKYRIRNTLNPLYWFEFPGKAVTKSSSYSNPWIQRILSLLFWAIGIIAAYLANQFLDVLFPELPSILESILR